ncbi:hypothetical protein [Streptomyces violaceusniger]
MPEDKGWKSPYLLLTVTMLLWGSAFSSSKSVVAQLPHTVAALLRFGGGAVALLAAVAVFGKPAAARPRPPRLPRVAAGGGRRSRASWGSSPTTASSSGGFRWRPRSTRASSSPCSARF